VDSAGRASDRSVVMLLHNDVVSDARVFREAEALTRAGYPVTILGLKGAGLPDCEVRDGYVIKRVAVASSASWRSPIAKMRQLRARTRAMTVHGIALEPAIVHCHDTDTLAAGVDIARVTGARLVHDAHELFPDMLGGHGRDSALVQRYWRRVERRLMPRSDLVIAVNDSRARVLRERYGVDPVVVRNVPSLEKCRGSQRLRAEYGISPGVPIVLYQGGLIGGRALVRLVHAMARVDDAVLVIQGSGPEESAIRSAISESGLRERGLLTGWIPPSDLHEYACGADLGVVIYENTSLNNYYAAPNKLYAYLMAGLPMVASDFPGLREIVLGEQVGAVFDPASEESIAGAIRGMLTDAGARTRMSRTALELAESRYNWAVESQRLLGAYRTLGARGVSQ